MFLPGLYDLRELPRFCPLSAAPLPSGKALSRVEPPEPPMQQSSPQTWNGDAPGACGSCGTVKRPVADGLCSLGPESIQSILPRVMADILSRTGA